MASQSINERGPMDYIQGTTRTQISLSPEAIDDYITEENPVRFIDVFVDGLDLVEAGFNRAQPGSTGRPPFDPRVLLKLYIYGYLNKVRTSRKLEQEAHRNVELMWLMQKLRPDHKTISDFRKDNRDSFKNVFRAFTVLCGKLNLFGGELIAVDGSKFKGVNSPRKNFTKKRLVKRLAEIDERIENYLSDLDASDRETPVDPADGKDLQSKIEMLQDRRGSYQNLLEGLVESDQNQVSLTDPDSRAMPNATGFKVGYNVQIAVDEKHKLIVAQNVTNEVNDVYLLSETSIEAKENLGVEKLRVVADSGYYNGEEFKTCESADIEPYVPKRRTSSSASKGLYAKDQFRYDATNDCYHCPADQILTYRGSAPNRSKRAKHILRTYRTSECKTCPLRVHCTRNKNGRAITRWEHEHIIEETDKRVASNPEMMKKRRELVEHPFGSMKFWNDQSHFLVRRIANVKAEFSLMTLAHNLRKVVNIVGVTKLMAAVA